MKKIIVDFLEWLEDTLKRPLLILKIFHLNRTIRKGNFFDFPIYIISFNRLSFLKQTVEWLQKYGYKNIVIIDNNSNYPPLLEYLDNCGCKVYRMKKNYGHRVFFKHPKFLLKRNLSFFALTDPDLEPVKDCPQDFIEQFFKVFQKYPYYSKIGFSLKIDDIPDSYYLKNEVIALEKKYYEKELKTNGSYRLYEANLDTTFSVFSPMIYTSNKKWYYAVRVGLPYQLRHLPWYGEDDSEELRHYKASVRKDVSNWNGNVSKDLIRERYNLK